MMIDVFVTLATLPGQMDVHGISPAFLATDQYWVSGEKDQFCVVGEPIIIVVEARNLLDFDIEISHLMLVCSLELHDGATGTIFSVCIFPETLNNLME